MHRRSQALARPRMSFQENFRSALRDFSKKFRDDVGDRILNESEFIAWVDFLREFFPRVICLVPSIGEVKQFYIDVIKNEGNAPDFCYTVEFFLTNIPRFLCDQKTEGVEYVLTKSDLVTALNNFKSGVTSSSAHWFFFLFRDLPFKKPKIEFITKKIDIFKDLLAKFEDEDESFVVIDWSSLEGMIFLSNFEELFGIYSKGANKPLDSGLKQYTEASKRSQRVRDEAFKISFKSPQLIKSLKEFLDKNFADWDPS
jgi:hypothetical protein